MIYKGIAGWSYDLASTPFAAGGEGEIYNINGQADLVAKIYKPGKASLDKEHKLIRMVGARPDSRVLSQIAWPQDVLYNVGCFAGFIMPKMNVNEALNVVYEYGSSAKYPHMPWKNRLIIAENLCAVLDCVHATGHTCGDLNPENISVNPKTGHIVFLDTDSYHIQDEMKTYRCNVGIPEYIAAEVQMKMRGSRTLSTAQLPTFTHASDNFALAIHIFQLLMNGVHPFACAIIPSQISVTAPQPSDNIIKGEFPFIQNIPGAKIPSYAPEISILPPELQQLFKRAFIDGHLFPSNRPTPVEWHTALRNLRNELQTCSLYAHHQYYNTLPSCPWCAVNAAYQQSYTLAQQAAAPVTSPFGIKPPAAPSGPPRLRSSAPSLPSFTSTPFSVNSALGGLFIGGIEGGLFGTIINLLSGFVSSPDLSSALNKLAAGDLSSKIVLIAAILLGTFAGFLWNGFESTQQKFSIPRSFLGMLLGGCIGLLAGGMIAFIVSIVITMVMMNSQQLSLENVIGSIATLCLMVCMAGGFMWTGRKNRKGRL